MMFRGPLLFYAFLVFLDICARASQLNAVLANNKISQAKHLYQKQQESSSQTSRNATNTKFAWSSWGSWSACSKTCGGGVAVQERHCLPSDASRMHRSRKKRKMTRERTERTRRSIANIINADSQYCLGISKRYHECNTAPCKGPHTEFRNEQCASYDQRPFRGRYYTWVPYVDGNSPCTLNCRPQGHHFYATLGLVADGTSCTYPGYRAICVQGECKVVGREGVISASTDIGGRQPVRCGRRLVSGLFTRPRLPLGYSYVTTVPRGACRLNVTEMSPSENYIALKLMNGSYIMNGEFAVSAPGIYEAAGARFHYSRNANLDSVFTRGPLQNAIDIMILYTQTNPSIKYEYLTDSDERPDETSNEIGSTNKQKPKPKPLQDAPSHQRHHRHHSAEPPPSSDLNAMAKHHNLLEIHNPGENVVGNRKFVWKILSFTTCSRTCGGGLQIGKFKCVEIHENNNEEKEISSAHCTGSPPPSRRRRCAMSPCKPRWRVGAWGPCPACGPAKQNRIVGCVQDHAKGITKVSDQTCPLPRPATSLECDIPDCGVISSANSGMLPKDQNDFRRHIRPRENTDTFRDHPVIEIAANASDNDVEPAFEPFYNNNNNDVQISGWLYTEWSECLGSCIGEGIQTRGARCSDPTGCPARDHNFSQSCKPKIPCEAHTGQWFTGEWSKCTANCEGQQIRGVLCIGGTGRRLRDTACRATKPAVIRSCGGSCSPTWYLSEWSTCQGPCEAGIQTRTVWCTRHGADGANGAAKDFECPGLRPQAKRTCVPSHCSTKPAVMKFIAPNVSEAKQPRVTRHEIQKPHEVPQLRSVAEGKDAACVDKLDNCMLAVQARLCHYRYYMEYCCLSCQVSKKS